MAKPKPSLGPLAKVVSKPKFEAGVLTRCTIVKDANHLAGHALWSTVQVLDAGAYAPADYAKLYRDPVMTALRVVRVDPKDNLVTLCTGKRVRPFETLVVDWFSTPAQAAALANATALPKLSRLELRCTVTDDDDDTTARKMMQVVAAATLDSLRIELPTGDTNIGAIHARAAVKRLELVDRQHLGATYGFERDARGALSRLAVTFEFPEKSRRYMGAWTGPDWCEAIFGNLEAALGSLRAGALTELSLVARPVMKKPANKRRLAAIAKRFGGTKA